MERERIIEVLLVMTFVVIVFIMMLIGLTLGNSTKTTSKTTFNTYNTIDNSEKNYYEYKEIHPTYIKYIKDESIKHWEPKKTYIWNDWDYNPKNYDSYGKHIKTYELGYYVDTYKVYVYNEGPGDYFTVKFYFENYEGHERSYDIRKYISHNDEELFYYRDISKDRYEYYKWKYKVFT